MATTTTAKGRAVKQSPSYTYKQQIDGYIDSLITAHFANTIGTATDIRNIVSAIVWNESRYEPNAKSGIINHQKEMFSSSAILKVYNSGSALQRANIDNYNQCVGLMQVTGYYCVKGGGSNGKSVLESLRSDICGPCMINPGDSIDTTMQGITNLQNQILAGLIVLEGKWLQNPGKLWPSQYPNRLQAAVSAYLGLGASDKFGTTPQGYSSSIMYGAAYAAANGVAGTAPPATSTASNPTSGTTPAPAAAPSKSTPGC